MTVQSPRLTVSCSGRYYDMQNKAFEDLPRHVDPVYSRQEWVPNFNEYCVRMSAHQKAEGAKQGAHGGDDPKPGSNPRGWPLGKKRKVTPVNSGY